MMIFKTAAILLVAATLAGCAPKPEPAPAPAPITPEVTYDKLGNPVYSDAT